MLILRAQLVAPALKRYAMRKGFTLIEIMVAAMIMAVTISGIFSVFTASAKYVMRAQRRLTAANIAQEEIEKRRVFVSQDAAWTAANDNIGLGFTPAGSWNPGSWIASPLNPQFVFQYRYKVEDDSHAEPYGSIPAEARCRRVYMQVHWNES